MSEYLTTPNAILAVGVLLLSAPYLNRLIGVWLASVIYPQAARSDFEKRTAGELIDLKNQLDKEGHDKASHICRDLIVALLYGEKKS
jgi:hypothetical protein